MNCQRTKREKEADSVCQDSPKNRTNRLHGETGKRKFILEVAHTVTAAEKPHDLPSGGPAEPVLLLSLGPRPKNQERWCLSAGGGGCPSLQRADSSFLCLSVLFRSSTDDMMPRGEPPSQTLVSSRNIRTRPQGQCLTSYLGVPKPTSQRRAGFRVLCY